MIDKSLYTYFSSQVPDFLVQEGKEDFSKIAPWIWFRRSSTIQERFLSGALCDNFTSTFDVEMVSTDIDEVQNACDNLKTALQSIVPYNTIGTTFCQYIEVQDHTDDYISRTAQNTDDGFYLCTFQLRIFHSA